MPKPIKTPSSLPKHLKPHYSEILAQLKELSLLHRADHQVILNLAIQQHRRDTLSDLLQREGEILGDFRLHPASKLLNEVIASILRMQGELGLNPKSRATILSRQKPQEEDNDIEELLNQ